jgi:hypothetical protein
MMRISLDYAGQQSLSRRSLGFGEMFMIEAAP